MKQNTPLHIPGENRVLSKIKAIPHGLLQYGIPVTGNQEWPAVC